MSTHYLHRTQYANLTTEELIREAYTEVQSKALTALGRELLFRLEHIVDNSVDVFGL